MALFLILLDFRRLWNIFVVNKPTEPIHRPPLIGPQAEELKNTIKWILVGIATVVALTYMFRMQKKWGPEAIKPALHGLYEVETFTRNGENLPPLTSDSSRWRRLDRRLERSSLRSGDDRSVGSIQFYA